MKATNELYAECAGIINKMVHHYSIKCPAMDTEELQAEAALIFCQACENYNPEKGTTFATHLYNQLAALTHCIRRSNRHSPELTSVVDTDGKTVDTLDLVGEPFSIADGDDYYKAMAPDAQAVVDLYFKGALTSAAKSHSRRKIRQINAWGAYHKLFRNMGWTWGRTQAAFENLRHFLDLYRRGDDIVEAIAIV